MEKIAKRIKKGFMSSCEITREFSCFETAFMKSIKNVLERNGCTNVEKAGRGHFEVSLFFDAPNGQTWYAHLCDVRWFGDMYMRRAKHRKDWTGDSNINISNVAQFESVLRSSLRSYDGKEMYV